MADRSIALAGIEVADAGACTAAEAAARSRAALDAPLVRQAALRVAIVGDEALVLGAFQRGVAAPDRWPLVRRGSGGPEARVGPGTLHVLLSLVHPGAAPVRSDARRIVNRAVRPLLRALTKTGFTAQFFGRDWISVAHRPAAWVGFAHDASTRRTTFEAFVAARVPFAVGDRASFRGKEPGTLEGLVGRSIDPARLAAAVIDAYADGLDAISADPDAPREPPRLDDLRGDPPWAATCDEAIGVLGAGPDRHGTFRIGGDLLVSRDALARLEAAVAAEPSPSDETLGRLVDEALGSNDVALDGVRSLTSVRDVIAAALRRPASPRSALP